MPNKDLSRKAALSLLKYYGMKTEKERLRAFESGFIFASWKDILKLKLSTIADIMDRFNNKG